MKNIKLGLIREGKIPPDKRVALTPLQSAEVMQRFPHVKIVCQPSEIRCFKDKEYEEQGVAIQEDLQDCDILMGIKEVPIQNLIADKTYLFFSHTLKKQPHNQKLLQEIIKKNINLIDYETLKDQQGNRLVAFGRYAGIVGAYNGLLAYGQKYNLFDLRRAKDCFDVNELKLEVRKIKLPSIKIVLTGRGRVGNGAMEILDTAGIKKVNPTDFLNSTFNYPVYTQLSSSDYHKRLEGGVFNRDEFHTNPQSYYSHFVDFTQQADLLIAGAFWSPNAPKLFSTKDILSPKFNIKVIADITCDIDGSLPCTKKTSTILDPLYDYSPVDDSIKDPLSHPTNITIMAIDNLPCELPRSASDEFGRDLIDRILKPLLVHDIEGIISRATMVKNKELTDSFKYLKDYVDAPIL